MKTKIFFIIIVLFFSSCSEMFTDKVLWNSEKAKELRYIAEMSYFEGQKDAMNGIWYIAYDETNKMYYWTKNIYSDSKDYLKNVSEGWDFEIQYIPPVGE